MSKISSSQRVTAVFAVRVSPGGPTAAPDAPPASDNAPATPNTVTAFVRSFRFEFRLRCDMVEASHFTPALVYHYTPTTVAMPVRTLDGHLTAQRVSQCPLWVINEHARRDCNVRFTPKADIHWCERHVRFVPIPDFRRAVHPASARVGRMISDGRAFCTTISVTLTFAEGSGQIAVIEKNRAIANF